MCLCTARSSNYADEELVGAFASSYYHRWYLVDTLRAFFPRGFHSEAFYDFVQRREWEMSAGMRLHRGGDANGIGNASATSTSTSLSRTVLGLLLGPWSSYLQLQPPAHAVVPHAEDDLAMHRVRHDGVGGRLLTRQVFYDFVREHEYDPFSPFAAHAQPAAAGSYSASHGLAAVVGWGAWHYKRL